MSKRPSLESLAQSAFTSERDNVATFQRDNVATLDRPRRVLRAPPHMSLYLSKKAQKALKEIALEYDRNGEKRNGGQIHICAHEARDGFAAFEV